MFRFAMTAGLIALIFSHSPHRQPADLTEMATAWGSSIVAAVATAAARDGLPEDLAGSPLRRTLIESAGPQLATALAAANSRAH